MKIKENNIIAHKEQISAILKDWDKLENVKKVGVRATLAEYVNKNYLHYETLCPTCASAQTYADRVFEFLKNQIKKITTKEKDIKNDTNNQ